MPCVGTAGACACPRHELLMGRVVQEQLELSDAQRALLREHHAEYLRQCALVGRQRAQAVRLLEAHMPPCYTGLHNVRKPGL